jgi:hypothetical protein
MAEDAVKIDLKKELKSLYSPSSKRSEIIEVPDFNYLAIDGQGDPSASELFKQAIESLYAVSYRIKFASKKHGSDYSVMPLDGLFWADDMNVFILGKRDSWKWTLMILQPDFIGEADAVTAAEEVWLKKGLSLMPRFERYVEGLSAQIMHIGPYSKEGPIIQKLHQFILSEGYQFNGKHHEIYLSDPRRSKPETMKTIIRQPIRKL